MFRGTVEKLGEFGWTDPAPQTKMAFLLSGSNGLASTLPMDEFYAPVYSMNDLSEAQRCQSYLPTCIG